MNMQRLYDYTSKMLDDDKLSNQEKRNLLSDWRHMTEAKIGGSISSAADIKEASEFLAQLSLWESSLANIE
jgi:peptidyl-tRNA hydrolase